MDRNGLDYDPGPVGESYTRLGPPLKADEHPDWARNHLTSDAVRPKQAPERVTPAHPEIWTYEL